MVHIPGLVGEFVKEQSLRLGQHEFLDMATSAIFYTSRDFQLSFELNSRISTLHRSEKLESVISYTSIECLIASF